jgi:hypothetical protein
MPSSDADKHEYTVVPEPEPMPEPGPVDMGEPVAPIDAPALISRPLES